MDDPPTMDIERALRAHISAGGRAFVPYLTGGLPGVDADLLRSLAALGADAIEVGIPFSDPVMDGGVIQEASKRALDAGATPERVLATIREASPGVPVAVMTYFNPVLRAGTDAFLAAAADAGVSGAIVPDLPVDEAGDWIELCAKEQIACVLLAAPGSDAARLRGIADASRGFVYCVATYGVTGARARLETTAEELVRSLRPLTDLPLVVGVGIGTPDQAREACRFADGVVVGTALMRPLIAGDRDTALALAAAFRDAAAPG